MDFHSIAMCVCMQRYLFICWAVIAIMLSRTDASWIEARCVKMCSLPLLCELALMWIFDRECVLFARATLNFVWTSQLFCKVPKE